ncbi:MAG: Fic family protein [Lachnospiraceae bacterium]|nr:Fic family protein [Lachnospiraceae bacterium]
MKDLFDLSQKECIELVKRNIIDCIYSSARIEGIGVTFPDTQKIYDGRSVAGLTVDDINKINNLKHAWQFVFDSIDYPLDFLYLRQLNQIINTALMSDAGKLREYDVQIGGTSWKPELPDADKIKEELNTILDIPCVTERAIKMMLYIMRTQMFSDGNKRVAQLAANQILIQNGKGFLEIPENQINEFFRLLIRFYETSDSKEIVDFIYRTSIFGKKIIKKQENVPISEEMFKKKR